MMRLVLILAVVASVCVMVYGQTGSSSSSSSSSISGLGSRPNVNMNRLYNMGGGGGRRPGGGNLMRNLMLMGGMGMSEMMELQICRSMRNPLMIMQCMAMFN